MYYVDRDGRFVVPFLVGALTGGVAVGVTRPRPVIATNNYPYNNMVPMNPGYYPYGNYYGGYGYNPYFH